MFKLYNNKYPITADADYVVDYIYDNTIGVNFYYQLVRLKDLAILCAYESRIDLIMHCWSAGIPKDKIAFI